MPDRQSSTSADKSVIARNTIANAGVSLLQLASAFIYMPLLIRSFGLADYGVFLLAGSLSIYLGLLDFGVNTTVVKRVAEYSALDRQDELRAVVVNAFAYYTIVGVVAAGLLVLVATFGVQVLALSGAEAQLGRSLFLVSACVALFNWPLGTGMAVLNGLQRYDISSVLGAVTVIVNLALTFGVLLLGGGPLALLAALGGASVVVGLAATGIAVRMIGGGALAPLRLISREHLRDLFSFSWMIFVLQFAVVMANQQTDRLVLAAFASAAAVGLYEPASRINGLVSQLSNLPSSALVPAASKMDAEMRPDTLRSLYLRGTKYTVFFVAPITVSLMVLAEPLLLRWLGPKVADAAAPAVVLLFAWLLHAQLSVSLAVFIGAGRMRFITWYYLATAVLNLGLSLALVGRMGVLGVALGATIADTVMFPLGIWYTLRTLGVRSREFLTFALLPTYPALAITGLCALGLRETTLMSTLFGVVSAGVGSSALYWIVVYVFGFTAYEKQDAAALIRSLRTRLARI